MGSFARVIVQVPIFNDLRNCGILMSFKSKPMQCCDRPLDLHSEKIADRVQHSMPVRGKSITNIMSVVNSGLQDKVGDGKYKQYKIIMQTAHLLRP